MRQAMRLMRSFTAIIAGLVLAANWASVAAAQDYPTRPVTIIVPYVSGGSTEILARLVGQRLEGRLGKPVLIENKPGAGTVIGATAVAKAAPDGYTLLMATPTPMAINVAVYKNLPYDPATSFVPLAMVGQSPFLLIVNPSLPVHSVRDLIAYAKKNPGRLSYGSGGPGAPHHLYAELLKSMAGIEMTHVPYKGSLPALNDVVAGHIQLMFCDIPPAAGMIEAGKVRALGVSTKTRVAAFPDIPTIAEAGVPGFAVAGWFMLAAPAKTPRSIIEKLHGELKSILAAPETKDQLTKLNLLPMDTPSIEDMQTFVKSEIVRWAQIVQQAGIAGSE
jgi:tripartite-type tricarboxylate transporter receptor subunit TctC